MYHSGHGYAALRKGRTSVPHATYFATLCVNNVVGRPLADDDLIIARPARFLHEHLTFIRQVLAEMEQDNAIQLRAGVVMPDHVHLLFRLAPDMSETAISARADPPRRKKQEKDSPRR